MHYRFLTLALLAACTNGATDDKTPDTELIEDSEPAVDTEPVEDSEPPVDTEPPIDTEPPVDTEVEPTVSDLALSFKFNFTGNTTDEGPDALPYVSGTVTYTTDRHGTANAAMAAGSCLRFGPQTYDGSSGAFSTAGWLRPTATFSTSSRQTMGGAGAGFYQWYWYGNTVSMEVYELIGESRRPTFFSAASELPLEQWTHVAFTFDVTAGGQFYLNGAPVTTNGSDWAAVIQSGMGDLIVGCGGDASFDADYDDIALWSRQLTADEVALLAEM